MNITKKCLRCSSLITKQVNESQKNWETRHKYCSRECSYRGKVGVKIHNPEYIKQLRERMKGNKYTLGVPAWNKGIPLTEEHKQKLRGRVNERNAKYIGNNAGTRAIHLWVERRKGKANLGKCVDCGVCSSNAKLGWSNKDHKYRRVVGDYIVRCASCHEQYDIKFNNKYKK